MDVPHQGISNANSELITSNIFLLKIPLNDQDLECSGRQIWAWILTLPLINFMIWGK